MTIKFVDSFIANMRDKGFAKANRYLVLIQPNPYVASQIGIPANSITQRLAMTCASVSQPSKSFTTHEMSVTQPVRLIPYGINTNNSSGVSVEFYVLGDMFEKNMFQMWQNIIIDPTTKQQSYYDDYAKGSSIIIAQMPNIVSSFEGGLKAMVELEQIAGIKLSEIYPYNFTVNGGSQNYASATEPLKVKVDFMFREITLIKEPKPSDINSGIRLVDDNGNFRIQQIRPTAEDILARSQLLRQAENVYTRNDVVRATLEEAQRDFAENQRRQAQMQLERSILQRGVTFIAQAQGMLGDL